MQRFRGGLVFEAHRIVYHSTLGLGVIKKKKVHATREHLERFPGLLLERQVQDLDLTVLYVPYSLDSGYAKGLNSPAYRRYTCMQR